MIASHEKPNKGGTDVWLTPLEIVRSLGEFDLDPCGHVGHDTAKRVITLPDDGLSLEWSGRVWLNPPYSEVERWLDKLATHGNGIALIFARVETKWAQKYLPLADSVFFPAGRFTFLKHDFTAPVGNAGAPSMLLAFGERPMWPMKGWMAK